MLESFVYIIKCNDGSYYTGVTSNIENRIEQHMNGYYPKCYTFKKRPLEVVFIQSFTAIENAIMLEKRIKGWSRKKKEAFIEGNWGKMKTLSKNYTEYGKPKVSID